MQKRVISIVIYVVRELIHYVIHLVVQSDQLGHIHQAIHHIVLNVQLDIFHLKKVPHHVLFVQQEQFLIRYTF